MIGQFVSALLQVSHAVSRKKVCKKPQNNKISIFCDIFQKQGTAFHYHRIFERNFCNDKFLPVMIFDREKNIKNTSKKCIQIINFLPFSSF